MKIINVQLNEEATLSCFIHNQNAEYGFGFKRPAMFIIPGGGYGFVSEREAEPIMGRFFGEGFNCFVLRYSINKKYPQPHKELAQAIDYVNKHKEEFDLNDTKCAVGFSAGGHLVGSYSYLYKELGELLDINPDSLRLDFIILAYPVITMKEATHGRTRNVITNNEEELIKKLSIEDHISHDYPATFIWTTAKDTNVLPINTEMMIDSLRKAGVCFESIIYPELEHGASLMSFDTRYNYSPFSEDEKAIRTWVDKSMEFFAKINK